jgi:hypothetical protein
MFIQVFRGQAGDPEAARRLMGRWMEELRPGATGFLGSTAGVTSNGQMIAMARFESADLARANSNRPEQGRWWQEMENTFSGPVRFKDSADVDVLMAGGSNDAGFVQVTTGKVVDKAKARALAPQLEREITAARPDVIGGVLAWHDDGTFTEAVYFTSEEAARAGEKGEMPAVVGEANTTMPVAEFLDLSNPWLW